jgi:hypothetical protein
MLERSSEACAASGKLVGRERVEHLPLTIHAGSRSADLRIVQPTKFERSINLSQNCQGAPLALRLARGHEVIE